LKQQLKASIINQKDGSKIGELILPTEDEHILYADFTVLKATATRVVNYLVGLQKLRDNNKDWKFSKLKYAKMLRECIRDYFKVSDKVVRQFVLGDIEKHIDERKNWKLKEKPELTLVGLYEYIYVVMFRYKPKVSDNGVDQSFKVGDQEYYIPSFVKDAIIGKTRNPRLTVQEVTEVLVIEDQYNKLKKGVKDDEEKGKDQKGKPTKGYQWKALVDYQKTLRKIAVFCRKKGEEIPTDELEFEKYVDQRYKELAAIKMPDALDALFFLQRISKSYENQKNANGILMEFQ